MKDLLFPVKKVPTKEILKGTEEPVQRIASAIVGAGKILSFASPNYALITNAEIKKGFDKFLVDQGIEYTFSYRTFGKARFRLSYTLDGFKVKVGDGKVNGDGPDFIAPVLNIDNSYDQTLKYQMNIQVMRLICTNGMVAMVDEQAIKMLHTPGADEGIAVEKSLGLIKDFQAEYEEIAEPFHELAEQGLSSWEGRLDEVVEETSFPQHLAEMAGEVIEWEVNTNKLPITDWLIYQALNYQLNHNADNLLGRKADSLDQAVLSYLWHY